MLPNKDKVLLLAELNGNEEEYNNANIKLRHVYDTHKHAYLYDLHELAIAGGIMGGIIIGSLGGALGVSAATLLVRILGFASIPTLAIGSGLTGIFIDNCILEPRAYKLVNMIKIVQKYLPIMMLGKSIS